MLNYFSCKHILQSALYRNPGDRNLGSAVRTSDITHETHICFLYHFSLQVTSHSNCQKHQGRNGRDSIALRQSSGCTRPACITNCPRTALRLVIQRSRMSESSSGLMGSGCRLRGSVASLPAFGLFQVHGSHGSRSPAPVLVDSIDWQETYKVGRRG